MNISPHSIQTFLSAFIPFNQSAASNFRYLGTHAENHGPGLSPAMSGFIAGSQNNGYVF